MTDTTTVQGPAAGRGGPSRPRPSVGLPDAWWPIAHGDEIGRHPTAFRIGTRDLAVYRDLSGVVRAVDDACPHRRLPLSMGRITEDGHLQCAYHGWCFDGATGQCTAIPNLGQHERVPRGIRVAAFRTAENVADALGFGLRTPVPAPAVGEPTGEEPDGGTTMFDAVLADGLVLVWTGAGEPPDAGSVPEESSAADTVDSRTITGSVFVRSAYTDLAEALLLNPGATLGLPGLLGAGEEVSAPSVTTSGSGPAGTVTVRRSRLARDLPRASTFGDLSRRVLTSTTTLAVTTGLARITVAPHGGSGGCHVVAALTPVGPYRTVLRWSATTRGNGAIMRSTLAGASSVRRRLLRTASDIPEAVADRVATTVDDGLEALRALRPVEAFQHTQGGTP
ncbi:Rieske 2Fe-2S domain-containing protein [Streptomyces sp. NPDC001604]|uniref:Rieske 2Fe-2S domain-containing protein n=1 Tax=Streptomyces sp. NPDC001604 TaxID=3364593 RepID=UPI0036AC4F28